jgi:hypothetical protein
MDERIWPRSPRSNPIAIPKGLTTRRRGHMMSIGWQSGLPETPEIPRPSTPRPRDEPVFIFPSSGQFQGVEWRETADADHPSFLARDRGILRQDSGWEDWPADTAAINHPPFLPPGQVVRGWGEGGGRAGAPIYRGPPPIPPIRRTETEMGDSYGAQLSIQQDSGTSTGITTSEAPIFFTSFMPIPEPNNLEHFESILPLNLSTLNLSPLNLSRR